MKTNRAARGSCNYSRAKHPGSVQKPSYILAKYTDSTLVAGLVIAISFGCMFVYGAVMF